MEKEKPISVGPKEQETSSSPRRGERFWQGKFRMESRGGGSLPKGNPFLKRGGKAII